MASSKGEGGGIKSRFVWEDDDIEFLGPDEKPAEKEPSVWERFVTFVGGGKRAVSKVPGPR
jgi:hypothetical protein